jgi:predicted SprT family Zn-dependent metalloprotease
MCVIHDYQFTKIIKPHHNHWLLLKEASAPPVLNTSSGNQHHAEEQLYVHYICVVCKYANLRNFASSAKGTRRTGSESVINGIETNFLE